MTEPTWWSYFKRIAGTETGRIIAEAAEVSEPQVSRWKSGKNRPDADALVRFARAYNRPPVEALIAAGYLDSQEVGEVVEVAMSTGDLAVDDLIEEMRRRIATAEAQSAFIDALTHGAAVWIGEAPHSPGVSISRVGDQVTANLVLSPSNELRIQPALAARTQGEPDDLTQEPSTTGSEGEADPHENSRAGGARNGDNNVEGLIETDQDDELDRRRRRGRDFTTNPIVERDAAAFEADDAPTDYEQFDEPDQPDPEGPEGGA
ncbi:helix-turn-helix transcriptional regulator [Gordonia sp. AC31]|uniref:helix-turn-helix domain-containing protein n=1 Tax=Gordonia sp. AC31 TaxID=2962571 RepID=UPI0028816134|nr:helix-turn-helix transcriptional regulator [Gordonia sp. AC31]MDT0223510.1 helix-turn-helix transcriptional regulator [Gordonia sp. AC31]